MAQFATNKKWLPIAVFFILLSNCLVVFASSTQIRLDEDIAAGTPIVIQVSVALADNKHQWIVPVPATLGNGQDAQSNLYWGARYGVKTYLLNDGGWIKLATAKPADKRIVERLVLKKNFFRRKKQVTVYLVADAWDGKYINDTIEQFIRYNAGRDIVKVDLGEVKLQAGGKSHLMVYVGHNALMDYFGTANWFLSNATPQPSNPDNDAIVLACKSEPYFSQRLKAVSARPILLTTGLMAPEAYSLHAAIEQWIAGGSAAKIKQAAANSYSRFQKTGRHAAERLFGLK